VERRLSLFSSSIRRLSSAVFAHKKVGKKMHNKKKRVNFFIKPILPYFKDKSRKIAPLAL